MDDDRMDEERIDPEVTEMLRGRYNAPQETPREEMWAVIQAGLTPRATVHSLDEARARRSAPMRRPFGWAVAAAAVLILGIGIGRMSAPTTQGPTGSNAAGTATTASSTPGAPDRVVLRAAAVDHLGRTEALLTVVRADARDGKLDPAMGAWARGLLTQTRLLLDSQGTQDPAMRDLLEDLELVLAQMVRVTHVEGADQARAQNEMNLALRGLEDRDVLPRIQAVVPAGSGLAGT
jgi:hypothetical protein